MHRHRATEATEAADVLRAGPGSSEKSSPFPPPNFSAGERQHSLSLGPEPEPGSWLLRGVGGISSSDRGEIESNHQ